MVTQKEITTALIEAVQSARNKGSAKKKTILQCEVSDPADIQTVQLFQPSGEQSSPPIGTRAIILNISPSYALAILGDDGIEPVEGLEPGEKILYSINNGSIAATLKFKLDGTVSFNNGSIEAARKGDSVETIISQIDFQDLALLLLSTGAFVPSGSVPIPATSSLTLTNGEIKTGTNEVLMP